jgi:hypothetical protein
MSAGGIVPMIRGGDTPPAGVGDWPDGEVFDGEAVDVALGDIVPEGVPLPDADCGELVEDPPADCFADVELQAVARQAIATADSPIRILEATPIPAPRIGSPSSRTVSGLECPRPSLHSFHPRAADGQSIWSGSGDGSGDRPVAEVKDVHGVCESMDARM